MRIALPRQCKGGRGMPPELLLLCSCAEVLRVTSTLLINRAYVHDDAGQGNACRVQQCCSVRCPAHTNRTKQQPAKYSNRRHTCVATKLVVITPPIQNRSKLPPLSYCKREI